MKTIVLFLFVVTLLVAQTGNVRHTTPALIPAVDSAVFMNPVTLYQVALTNETAADVECYIKTKQTTPRTIFGGTVYANSHYIMAYTAGYYSASGISWYCSSGTAVNAQITYRQ